MKKKRLSHRTKINLNYPATVHTGKDSDLQTSPFP